MRPVASDSASLRCYLLTYLSSARPVGQSLTLRVGLSIMKPPLEAHVLPYVWIQPRDARPAPPVASPPHPRAAGLSPHPPDHRRYHAPPRQPRLPPAAEPHPHS